MHADILQQLEWRCIGPYRGGRVVAVAGDPFQSTVFYFGSTGGGVWKTNDGGQYWENCSDGFFRRASVGAIAVAPSDSNVIYVGMGETTIRGNVSHGDGVYKSSDAGKTWQHLGLAETRHIGKIRVHPQNPDIVFVAALGHAHGPNAERGVYRSTDGGATWELVLFRNEDTGASDLTIDPLNPRIIYAAFWEARRGPHYLSSGGPGCGLFKSSDGGSTWVELSDNPGMPKGVKGKIGVVASPACRDRVWALVEAEEGGVFRSDDGGATWTRLNEDRNLRQRAWYYTHIYADPQDADTLWVLNVETWRSIDGGKTFQKVPVPHGDNHDLWIDPRNPQRMIIGNDGGAAVSYNGGASWSSLYNQPTSELYHVTVDSRTPYRVYGAQQDNTTISVPSRSRYESITTTEWYEVGGGESGYIAVRPDNPNIVYAGNFQGYLTRYDHARGQLRNIMVWPEGFSGWGAKDQKYRFAWTAPTILSPHDPNILYTAGNIIFRSRDEGVTWEVISPDLSRNDPATLEPSGGPITKDNTGAEVYATVFALAESPLQPGLLWAGSDDGLIHISRDAGANWTNITPPDLPEWALISIIEPSPHDPATAYVAATRYKLDDFQPYLFKTSDYGASWARIDAGIPADDFTRVIRVDPIRPGLLYVGTETGIYVSFDDGGAWLRLGGNPMPSHERALPVVPVHDMLIKGDDLVVATHGRSFWILGELALLRQLAAQTEVAVPQLFQPRDTLRFTKIPGFGHEPVPGKNYGFANGIINAYTFKLTPDGEPKRSNLDVGINPPDGVVVQYLLKEAPADPISLTILDADGNEIRTFYSKPANAPKPKEGEANPADQEPKIPAKAGLNRFVWDFGYPQATRITSGDGDKGANVVPAALPGHYQVRLSIGEQHFTQPFTILADPNVTASLEDLAAQFDLLIQIRDKLSAVHGAVNQIRAIRTQVEAWVRYSEKTAAAAQLEAAATSLKERLAAIEGELLQVQAKSSQDTLNYPIKLNSKLGFLGWIVGAADAAPTRAAYEHFGELSAQVEVQLEQLRQVIASDVAAFNTLVREAELPAVVVEG